MIGQRGGRGCLLGQRPLFSKRTCWRNCRWGAGLACSRGHLGEQLGVYGDDGVGLEPEGLVGAGLPEGRAAGKEKHRTEKRWLLGLELRPCECFVRLPCQIIPHRRKLIYRLLSWNPYQPIFFRLVDALSVDVGNHEVGSPDASDPQRRAKSNLAEMRVSLATTQW